MAPREIAESNIQGHILAGFKNHHRRLVLLKFGAPSEARRWLRAVRPLVSSTRDVATFNRLYSSMRGQAGSSPPAVRATWINVAFTVGGLRHLGRSGAELHSLGEAFEQGMAARAALLGDTGPSAPSQWLPAYRDPGLHALLIVAADDPTDLEQRVTTLSQLASAHGLTELRSEPGQALDGREHFGFKDGIAQPSIAGFDDPARASAPEGQVYAGEFVLGYETQDPSPGATRTAPNLTPVPPVAGHWPGWALDGSFLVLRRLKQDVRAFRQFVTDEAVRRGVPAHDVGAMLVGRYEDGTPLIPSADSSQNAFGYTRLGAMPDAAHIRKTNPRDDPRRVVRGRAIGLAETQKHRIIRRGIPYGATFDPLHPDDSDRGLLFMAYQASIEGQFEHVQRNWANNPRFPPSAFGDEPGHDPLIGAPDGAPTRIPRFFRFPPSASARVSPRTEMDSLAPWVVTTGGAYFFQPSISALDALSGD